MPLYRCCEDWEHSGYDDSDWHCVAFNTDTGKLERVLTGSTRFGNGLRLDHGVLSMTDEVRPLAYEALIVLYTKILTGQEERAVMMPAIKTLTRGTRIRFLEDHRCMAKSKEVEEVPCEKCAGSGKWTNPRNARDKRECFACKGSGKGKKTTRSRVKGDDGKPVWEDVAAGALGTIQGQATFGTFYRNGYSQPDRHNTTAYVLLDDGREVRTSAHKLRLDREIKSAEDMRLAGEAEAAASGYYPPFATSGIRML